MDSTRINSETTGANSMRTGALKGATGNGEQIASMASQSSSSHNMDALLKRLMKFKHLEDDNKKLKNLLK